MNRGGIIEVEMFRISTELADTLNYRLREALGAQVDYRATLMPNELALGVEIRQPEHLRGLTFIFRENDPLPEAIRRAANLVNVAPVVFDGMTNANTAMPPRWTRVDYPRGYETNFNNVTMPEGEGEGRPMANLPMMRTQEQELRFLELDRRVRTEIFDMRTGEEYNRLYGMTTFVPATPQVRSAEQQSRYEELADMTNPWSDAQRREYERLHVMAPHPHPIAPRTYVRVHRDSYNSWNITVRVGSENRDLPSIAVIKALINPADKHFLPSRQGRRYSTIRLLRNSLEAGLPAQSLHDALRAWVMATENQVTEAESSLPATGIDPATASLLRAQPATLEVGGRVFRLVPAHEIDVRPLITRVRQRTIAQARVESEAVRERARTDARVLTTEAESRAARIRAEAEEVARRAGAKIPDWVRDAKLAHCYTGSHWAVRMSVGCLLKDIRLYVNEWMITLHWKPTYPRTEDYYANRFVWVWLKLGVDGAWDKNSIYTRSDEYSTPHISSFMCMDLQATPKRIDSLLALQQLQKAITRGMQVINLNSPLDRNVSNYYPEIREQMPPTPTKLMTGEYAIRGRTPYLDFKRLNPAITWDSEESVQAENAGTFNVDTPAPTLPTPTIIPPHATAIAEAEAIVAEAEARTRR